MPTIRPFARQDNYTVFDNYVLDVVMPSLSPTAWKVLCLIVRKTKGWGKEGDQLSYSQIREGTGISSDQTVNRALAALLERGYIVVIDRGEWEAAEYRLNMALEVEVANPSTTKSVVEPPTTKSVATTKNVVDSTTKSVVEPTTKSVETERKSKEREKKGRTPPAPPSETPSLEPPPDTTTKRDLMFERLAWIVGVDWHTCGERKRGQLNSALGTLRKAGYTAEHLSEWWRAVWLKDFRWTEKSSRPTIQQVLDEIGKLGLTVNGAGPPQDDGSVFIPGAGRVKRGAA